ncbi:sulfurtransferase complex subunit TusB [Halomonas vilamensis]|uniref:Sulfurtransferase complex subunit TusB n=1 Tax=Vreelandella vilamensis TaxID=531309 RepID=A0ABU1H254_9GAMM|nr:sulfurtransferase complex subunit TusB [Halomonas vilamensis]MDR5898299.1 sulfurtransferase complex subunit TusB [Halomonas vilamensis]
MLLHIVNRAPQFSEAASQALRAMGPEDKLVLIEDAVVAVLDQAWQGWSLPPERIFVMEEDLEARGILALAEPKLRVDINRFVTLSAQCQQTISWH